MHTIYPTCAISHFQYFLRQIGWIVCILGRGDLICSRMNQPFERISSTIAPKNKSKRRALLSECGGAYERLLWYG